MVILKADTGERVMHFAELDPRAFEEDRRALVIRPLTRLVNGARYIVAIRGLVDISETRRGNPELLQRGV